MVQVLSGQNKAVGKGLVLGAASIYFPGFPRRWDARRYRLCQLQTDARWCCFPRYGQGCRQAGMQASRDAPRPPSWLSLILLHFTKREADAGNAEGWEGGGIAKMPAGARTSAAPGFQLISSLFIGIERDARVNNSIPKRSPAQGSQRRKCFREKKKSPLTS